jgi:hypothetical protein
MPPADTGAKYFRPGVGVCWGIRGVPNSSTPRSSFRCADHNLAPRVRGSEVSYGVTSGKAQGEQMFSALCSTTDIKTVISASCPLQLATTEVGFLSEKIELFACE